MVTLPGDGQLPPPVADDRCADCEGRIEVDQPAALLDVKLHEVADPPECVVVLAEMSRVQPVGSCSLCEAHAIGVPEVPCRIRIDPARQQPRSETGNSETGAFLFRKHRDGQRPLRLHAPLLQDVDGGECRSDPEGPVKRAAAGNGVQVAAGDECAVPRAVAALRAGVPPGPEDAVAVGLDLEAAPGCLLLEPRPQVQLRVGEDRPGVPAAGRVPPDILDCSQQVAYAVQWFPFPCADVLPEDVLYPCAVPDIGPRLTSTLLSQSIRRSSL